MIDDWNDAFAVVDGNVKMDDDDVGMWSNDVAEIDGCVGRRSAEQSMWWLALPPTVVEPDYDDVADVVD